MNLNLHWISNKFVEVRVDEVETGTLNAKEAKELAADLISLAGELLSVDD